MVQILQTGSQSADLPVRRSAADAPVLRPTTSQGGNWTFKIAEAAEEIAATLPPEQFVDEIEIEETEPPPRQDQVEKIFRAMYDEALCEQLPDHLVRLMKASDHLPALMELLAKLTPDPAKQYLLLAAALDAAQDRHDVAAKLSDAMRRLIEQHGPEIRAGLNTHEVASMFAADVEPVGRNAAATQYRAAYRAVVLETHSLPALFKCLLKDFGDRYAAGIDHLLRGIGLELRSISPSTDRTRLNDSLQAVYLLQAASTVLQRCVPVCRHLEAVGVKLASSTLAYEFAELLSQKPLRASILNQVALRLGASANEGQLILLHGILSLFRLTPMKLFSEPEQRLQVIATIQIVLDQKIYIEEKEKDDAQRERERETRRRHRDSGNSSNEDEDGADRRSQHEDEQ